VKPASRRRIRLAFLGLAGLFLLWLPLEDDTELWVVLLAMAVCALGAISLGANFRDRVQKRLKSEVPLHARAGMLSLLGALAGAAVAPAALLLMAIKTALHGHGAPDFTPAQMLSLLERMPLWALSGLLIALGFAIGLEIGSDP
jgi:hypothetical protein